MSDLIAQWPWVLGLTVLFEVVTYGLRFGLGRESRRDFAFVGRLTFGWRVHHGYIGLGMVLLASLWPLAPFVQLWGTRIGWALFWSDAVHHFGVLWPITGSPEFDLRYLEEPG